MKSLALVLASIAMIGMVGVANAQEDKAKAAGCLNCHATDTKKIGPSFKDIAAKYKGNASAEADLVAKLKSGKGHPAIKLSDSELTGVVKWVLSQ